MAKSGPKRKVMDWKQFNKLCGFQCTLEEIAAWYDCSVDTIERLVKKEKGIGFAEYYQQKKKIGAVSLRRAQMQYALAGNTALLIWLGKNLLGQTEKIEITNDELMKEELEILTKSQKYNANNRIANLVNN